MRLLRPAVVACALVLLLAPRRASAQTGATAPAAEGGAVRCPGEGLVANDDTKGHCCWPGQAWSSTKSACVGTPTQCPPGARPVGDDCVIPAPTTAQPAAVACDDGRVALAGGHCCWPGQRWDDYGEGRCVGAPTGCPTGFTLDAANEACQPPACEEGRERVEDGMHCCWPGQQWSRKAGECTGAATSCPPERDLVDGECRRNEERAGLAELRQRGIAGWRVVTYAALGVGDAIGDGSYASTVDGSTSRAGVHVVNLNGLLFSLGAGVRYPLLPHFELQARLTLHALVGFGGVLFCNDNECARLGLSDKPLAVTPAGPSITGALLPDVTLRYRPIPTYRPLYVGLGGGLGAFLGTGPLAVSAGCNSCSGHFDIIDLVVVPLVAEAGVLLGDHDGFDVGLRISVGGNLAGAYYSAVAAAGWAIR